MRPKVTPIGLLFARTAKKVSAAFDDALAEKDGSRSTWLILMCLMRGEHRMQAELAEEVGIQGPTLTHHLNAMERDGLIVRRRLPSNRRVHQVELTEEGRRVFHRLRDAAARHDERLRTGFTQAELDLLRDMLNRLAKNADERSDETSEDVE